MIHTVQIDGRSVTVSLMPGQRIVERGDDLFLAVGPIEHPVVWMRIDEDNARIAEMLVRKPVVADA